MRKQLIRVWLLVFAIILLLISAYLLNSNNEAAAATEAVAAYSEINLQSSQALVNSEQKLIKRRDELLEQLKQAKTAVIYDEDEMKQKYLDNVIRLEKKILDGETDKKIAYLTFDDGPYEEVTEQILSTLAEKGAFATFFVVGKPQYKEKYIEIAEQGHTIANHSYSHNIKYTGVDEFIADIEKLDEIVYQATGVHTDIVRFPGGTAQAKEFKDEIAKRLVEKGYSYIDWNSSTMDGFNYRVSGEEAYNSAVSQAMKHKLAVVLMHDYSEGTREALPKIIDKLREEGYVFLPLFKESKTMKNM